MKKISILVLTVFVVLGMVACASNPGTAPVITVTMPDFPEGDDAYAPDPDKASDPLVLGLRSSAPIASWKISISLQRQGQGGGGGQAQAAPSGDAAPADQPQRQRRAFFEYEGKKMPSRWQWDYKSTAREGRDPRMVTSLQTYRFEITATDKWGNVGTAEGTIPIGVIIVKDNEGNYRMAVPAIVFPPNDSDLSKVSDSDQASNRRVLRLVARVLNKYDTYAVTVEGHANPEYADGTPEREKEETTELVPLSEKRAQAVAVYLAANDNVSVNRLKSVGMGGQRTIAAWDDAENNWTNRRVEFILHK